MAITKINSAQDDSWNGVLDKVGIYPDFDINPKNGDDQLVED
jgi:hypothetical protein